MATKGNGRKPAKRTGVTKATITAKVRKAGETNATKGAKAFYVSDSLNAKVAKATTLPSLTEAGLAKSGKVGRTAKDAQARRDFAKSIGAPLVDVSEIVHSNKGGEILHDRPENLVRVRLASIAKVMGGRHRFYAIRAEAFTEGEIPKVYVVRL